MAISVPILAAICSLHIVAFVLAIGGERRRSKSKVVPDEYDEMTFCQYDSDIATVYGLVALLVVLFSHALLNGVTRCLCCGRGIPAGRYRTCAVLCFALSWITFVVAEACLLAGAARNAYHTKYRAQFQVEHLSCAQLRRGVFAAGAAMVLLSLLVSLGFYWSFCKAQSGGWQRHKDEGLPMRHFSESQSA